MTYVDRLDRAWPVMKRLMQLHVAAYRATGGRIGHRPPGGRPAMLLLDHVGARSGVRRTAPLIYVRDGDNVAIVASRAGHARNPAWFHNLRANPETTVQIGSERRAVRARLATPEERARLWPRAVEEWRYYDGYQRRTKREIPIVVLEPRT